MKNRLVSTALVFGALIFAPTNPVRAEDDQPACGMLPPEIVRDNLNAGFGSCGLEQVREQPLWKGLRSEKLVHQSRFTIAQGHLRWIWTFRIDERQNGTGRVEVTRIGRSHGSPYRMEKERHWHRAINKKDMALFNRLTKEAGLWKFENSTWDDGDELCLHCDSLEMESVKPDGFRFSHATLGNNYSAKLRATLEHVLDISNLDWDSIYSR